MRCLELRDLGEQRVALGEELVGRLGDLRVLRFHRRLHVFVLLRRGFKIGRRLLSLGFGNLERGDLLGQRELRLLQLRDLLPLGFQLGDELIALTLQLCHPLLHLGNLLLDAGALGVVPGGGVCQLAFLLLQRQLCDLELGPDGVEG